MGFAIVAIGFTMFALGYGLISDRRQSNTDTTTVTLPGRPPSHPNRDDSSGVENWLNAQIDYYTRVIEVEDEKHQRETPAVNEGLFYTIVALAILSLIAIGVTIPQLVPSTLVVFGIPINPQLFAYIPLVAYVIVSFRSVDVDRIAGADFFGNPVMQFKRGLKWVPFGSLKFRKEFGTFVQAEFPGDADHIQWGDEKEDLLPGKVRPIYALTAENHKGNLSSEMQLNIGISALAKFQVVATRFFDFVTNVGRVDARKRDGILVTMTGGENVSDYTLEVVRHLRDTSTSVLQEIVGQMSYNELTQHRHLVNTLYWLRLKKTVIRWGIEMVEVGITNTNPGHGFNEDLQKRNKAIHTRDAMITEAEGEKVQLTKRGEGAAAAELALLNARAEGYKKIAETAKTAAGKVAISADVAGKLAGSENSTIVVGADGLRELVGLVATAKKVK